jgi:hypothetical protein
MMRKGIVLAAGLALVASVTGCRVRTEKDANGEEKNVQIDTPFGGVHVNTDQMTAADLGLPVYPGAEMIKGDDKHKAADVHMGFGEWQLRVRAVSYATTDSPDKVAAFYKKALGRYGDVVTCQGNAPVGTPTATAEGLTCSNGGHTNFEFNGNKNGIPDPHGMQLKAGSKRHQHIIAFDDAKDGDRTRFALVALDLPASVDSKDDKSD